MALHERQSSSFAGMTVLQVPSDTIACVQGHWTGISTDWQVKGGERKKRNGESGEYGQSQSESAMCIAKFKLKPK